MAKPVTIPEFNTGGANRVAPSAGAKVTGYTLGQKPTSGVLNWLFAWLWSWIVWADDTIANDAVGFTGDQVLALSALGSSANNTNSGPVGQLGYWEWGVGASLVSRDIPLIQGDRIKSVTFARYGDGSADMDVGIGHMTAAGTYTLINPGAVVTTVTNPGAAWADTTIDVTDTTLAAGDCLSIYFDGNAVNLRVSNIRVTYSHPD